ncbi:MAG: histidine ammonia-lyase [Pseudomonadota bacterium]
MPRVVMLDGQRLAPGDVVDVAHGARVRLEGAARARMAFGAEGYARDAAGVPGVLAQKRARLVGPGVDSDDPASFILGHCAAVGDPLPREIVRALVVCRANVLAVGASGVRPEVVDTLLALLESGMVPVVPSQGSVGAAGDLAPLAHVARVACGLGGDVTLADGRVVRSDAALLRAHGVTPIVPTSKEALALINGATLTAALAAFAVHRARRLLDAMEMACAMTMEAVRADRRALSVQAVDARNHPGGSRAAQRLGRLLEGSSLCVPGRPPDAFSLRAAPAVLGAAGDALGWVTEVVARELNGACDNPLWFHGEGIVEVGNFHGAPVALALDTLRIAMVQAATQSERRTYRLSSGHLTGDLPSFLVEGTGLNSGFMLAQYTAASLASECKGLAHPAVVDTIPTVQHHEDHVSMGPIAGRLTLRVLECVADIVAIESVLAAQALDFRAEGVAFPDGARVDGPRVALAQGVARGHAAVRGVVARWVDDATMHPVLSAAGALVRRGGLSGDVGTPW